MTASPWWPAIGIPLLIFCARVVDVSLGTFRIILISRGMRRPAAMVGFFELLIWVVALGQMVQHLDRPLNYIAYAGGFAAGTWMGMFLEGRIALGMYVVRIITSDDARELIEALGESRFGVTSFAARGLQGRVRLILTVIRRRDFGRLVELVRRKSPKAFISVSDVRLAQEGFLPSAVLSTPRLLALFGKK